MDGKRTLIGHFSKIGILGRKEPSFICWETFWSLELWERCVASTIGTILFSSRMNTKNG